MACEMPKCIFDVLRRDWCFDLFLHILLFMAAFYRLWCMCSNSYDGIINSCYCIPFVLHLLRRITIHSPSQKYRGMGSLDAMKKGSEARYLSDTQSLKIAQGVSGTVKDKGSVRKTVPYLAQAVKQGFQDLGVQDIPQARKALLSGTMRMECRTGAAQHEGGVHDLLTYEKTPW